MTNALSKRVAIVGAGISGLALAWQLRKRNPDLQIQIFEKSPHPGGNIRSEREGDFLVEMGPNGFLDSKPSTLQLCRELGLGDKLIAASDGARKNRYVFWEGKLQALPNSLSSFLGSRLLSWRMKWGLMTERFRRAPIDNPVDESIDSFARRRAGQGIADIVANAMVTGIQGGDPKLLSLPACFPRLAKFEREAGSVLGGMKRARRIRNREAKRRGETPPKPGRMWSFRNGLGVLIERLHREFEKELLLDTGIRSIERLPKSMWRLKDDREHTSDFDAVVLTTPAYVQAPLLESLDAKIAEELSIIPYNRIAVVALGFRGVPTRFPIDGFGFIVPQSLKRDILGVQWCSSIFEGRAAPGDSLWRVLCGGWNRPEILDWSDEKIFEAVRTELQLMMGVTDTPIYRRIVRWPKAIPQYTIGHLERLRRIDDLMQHNPGVFLGGNAFQGIALNDCTEQGELLAERITRYLRTN